MSQPKQIIGQMQLSPRAVDDGPLDQVFQLPDIAGPGVIL